MKATSTSIAIATAVTVVAGLCFALPRQSPVATDPFPGIYSIIDPVTGETKDVLKVEPLLGEYVVLARCRPRAMDGPHLRQSHGQRRRLRVAATVPADRMVSALSLDEIGYLYHTPGNSDSRVGPSDTGYISGIASFGITPLSTGPCLRATIGAVSGACTHTRPARESARYRSVP